MVPMFIRVKSTPNSPRRSVQIVQSLRQGSQVRQKIIRHVGIAMDNQELEQLKELAEFIKAGIQTQTQASFFSQEELARQVNEARRQAPTHPMKVDLSALRETQRAISGIHEVYGQLYRELDLHWLLPVSRYRASSEALFQCVMARIANPKSKRASVRLLEEDFGVRLPLEKVYRMMDQLDMSRVERLQKLSGAAAESLLAEPLDLLFFDCTTLYFESFVADELKQPGYSKDAKFKESQVLLALMVTPGGLPASYEVLPGSSFEGHSLLPVIERMRRRHTLRRGGDRGGPGHAQRGEPQGAGVGRCALHRGRPVAKTSEECAGAVAGFEPLPGECARRRSPDGVVPSGSARGGEAFAGAGTKGCTGPAGCGGEVDQENRQEPEPEKPAEQLRLQEIPAHRRGQSPASGSGENGRGAALGRPARGGDQLGTDGGRRGAGALPWPVAGRGGIPGQQARPSSAPDLPLDPRAHPGA